MAALLPEQTASYRSGIWQGQVAHRDRPLNKDVSHTLSCYSVNSSFNLLRSLKAQPTSNLWVPPVNTTLSDFSQHSVMQSKIMIILQIKLFALYFKPQNYFSLSLLFLLLLFPYRIPSRPFFSCPDGKMTLPTSSYCFKDVSETLLREKGTEVQRL